MNVFLIISPVTVLSSTGRRNTVSLSKKMECKLRFVKLDQTIPQSNNQKCGIVGNAGNL